MSENIEPLPDISSDFDSRLKAVEHTVESLKGRLKFAEDRLATLDERTCDHENRLEDLEKAEDEIAGS